MMNNIDDMLIYQVIDIATVAGSMMTEEISHIHSKGDDATNNVTDLDVKVENYLKEQLLEILQGSGFVGEESDERDYSSEYYWVVDPIDGTMNMIRGLGLSAVSIALLYEHQVILAVVYNPFTKEVYYAQMGKGAYLNGDRISVSDASFEHSLFCTAWSTYDKAMTKPCMDIMEQVYARCNDIRRLGTAAVELAYLAAGRVDLYFEIRLHPWDYAAGVLILREAGGYVGTIELDEIVYDRSIPLIAANTQENYERLRQIVLEHVPQIPYDE